MRRHRLSTCLLLVLCWAGTAVAAEDAGLRDLWRAGEAGAYKAPRAGETEAARGLFARLFRGDAAPEAWRELGFELLRVHRGGRAYWIVREAPGRQEGRGWYAVAVEPAPDLLLLPHRRDDFRSGELGLKLLADRRFGGAGWNTVPRREVDFAHQPGGHFDAFVAAWSAVHERGQALQLHGFSAERHPDLAASAVVSAGTRPPSAAARRYARCLDQRFPGEIALYGESAWELGGTTNAQGQLLRASGHDGFLHLEMRRDWRERLYRQPEARRALAECLP